MRTQSTRQPVWPANRRGITMVEFLVVFGIVVVLFAILLPAVQRVRVASRRVECSNNLHQLGVAVHNYIDSAEVFPYARVCPAPWAGGKDLYCATVPSPVTYVVAGRRGAPRAASAASSADGADRRSCRCRGACMSP